MDGEKTEQSVKLAVLVAAAATVCALALGDVVRAWLIQPQADETPNRIELSELSPPMDVVQP